uniref:NADH-ubiquinone oxidoreductase chain 4 n=1 Tax=Metastrongylus pudendotectus TaxID=55275 RepID=D3J841_METPU|nr:NADH dehydrogenase subunit 4 [Metastrongylus pudendotectus]ACX85140.1 NADH dehydrogenase subunit 4 [Metastrongylus pudendotectus]
MFYWLVFLLLILNVFFFVLVLMIFLMFNNFSWMGIFMFFDSFVFIMLIMMMLFILGLVVLSELESSLIFLSSMLIMFCFFFFVSSNMLMLYIFFELSIFPILVMILGFGLQIEKVSSSYYLLFYTIFCSLPFLFVYYKSFFFLSYCFFDFFLSWEVYLVLTLSFMMKFPVYFLHLWLPKAHVEAPTTASMLLAGLLLKLGTAGFLRIMGSMNFLYNNFWICLSFFGMLLSSFSCLFQSDIKSLAAYSSIVHMSFLLLSLSILYLPGKVSGLLMMLAHGYTSTLMFFLIGEFFHISNSRMIYFFNSFFCSNIMFTIVVFSVFLSNSGVPPSLSFLSEFIVIVSSILMSKVFFLFLFMYFFLSFYYSTYVVVNFFLGSNFVNFHYNGVGYSIPVFLMMFNMFWWSVLY